MHVLIIAASQEEADKLFQEISGEVLVAEITDHHTNITHHDANVEVTVTASVSKIMTLNGAWTHIVFAGNDQDLAKFAANNGITQNITNRTVYLLQPESDKDTNTTAFTAFNKKFNPTAVFSKDELLNTLAPAPRKPSIEKNVSATLVTQSGGSDTTKNPSKLMSILIGGGVNNSNNNKTPTAVDRILELLGLQKTKAMGVMGMTLKYTDAEITTQVAEKVEKIVEENTLFNRTMNNIKRFLNLDNNTSVVDTEAAVETLAKQASQLKTENAGLKESNQTLTQQVGLQKKEFSKALQDKSVIISHQTQEIERLNTANSLQKQDLATKNAKQNFIDPKTILNALKLNWNEPRQLEFWEAQTWGGGIKTKINGQYFNLPNRIHHIIHELKEKPDLSEEDVKEIVQRVRADTQLSNIIGSLTRRSVTSHFYHTASLDANDSSSLQNYMDTNFQTWERKKYPTNVR